MLFALCLHRLEPDQHGPPWTERDLPQWLKRNPVPGLYASAHLKQTYRRASYARMA
jgi:hypothetical protein